MKSRNNVMFSAILSVLGFVSIALEADAAAVTVSTCTVNAVMMDGSTTATRLRVAASCTSGGNVTLYSYHGYSCTPSGVNKSAGVIEGFRSTAQAALLSGKKVTMVYDNATSGGCSNGIYSIDLVN